MSGKKNENKSTRKHYNRELPPLGTKLTGKMRKQEYEAVIAKSSLNPKKRVLSCDGREFSSLSSAATTITGHATNGWVFWIIKGKSK